jgi:histidinol-phosphate aminotransferase
MNGDQVRPQPTWKLDLNERCEGAPAWVEQVKPPAHYFWQYIDRVPLERDLAARFALEPAQVLATNGGDEGILYLFQEMGPGAPVHLPLPTFGVYLEQAEIQPLVPHLLAPKTELRLDLEQLSENVARHPGGLAVVVRPNNPTGEVVAAGAVRRLLEHCADNDTLLLVDEAYAEFADDDLISALEAHPNLVILRTFSKAFGFAGLRIGYLLGHPDLIGRLARRALPYNMNALSIFYGRKALETAPLREMEAYCEQVREARETLFNHLTEMRIRVFRSQANFLLLELGPIRKQFVAAVLRAGGISTRIFSRPELDACLRISIPTKTDHLTEILTRALKPDLICLDIDGCLVDVHESFDAVVRATVHHFTGQSVADEAIWELRAAGGFNDDNVLALELIRRQGRDPGLAAVQKVFREAYIGDESRPGLHQREKPLIEAAFLNRLCRDFKLALITGRNREEGPLAVRLLGLSESIPMWTIEDVALGKPDPEGVKAAAAHFNARRVWMVGDNPDDMKAAIGAGAVGIGVGAHRQALLDAGATIVLDHINQLEVLL